MASNSGISASGSSQVSVLNDVNGDYISVKCGSIGGKLFFNKLKAAATVNLGAVKCISYDDTWLTPNEFETRGGKSKSKYWKRSIMHNNVPLQSILPSLGIDKSPSTSQHGNATSSSNTDCLVDPILAFVKAHRLRGDLDSLKSVLYESFDTTKVILL